MFNVYCRFRPLNNLERSDDTCIEESMSTTNTVVIRNGESLLSFNFDRNFYATTTQEEMYHECVERRLDTFIETNQHCNILTYGQTSSGKTWTIDGSFYGDKKDDHTNLGLMPRILGRLCEVFDRQLEISCYEIYCEKIYDLLATNDARNGGAPKECKFTEINGQINMDLKRISSTNCATTDEVYKFLAQTLRRANKNRHFASTAMNNTSSRSHTFIDFVAPTKSGQRKKTFRLIDLAGSERVSKTLARDKVLTEGININSSLMYLKQMVEMIAASRQTLPKFRETKLTRIVHASIKNNDSSVVLILCCSPATRNTSETINTLRFGSTATKITRQTTLTNDVATKSDRDQLFELEEKFERERAIERRKFEERLSSYEERIATLSREIEMAAKSTTEPQLTREEETNNLTNNPSGKETTKKSTREVQTNQREHETTELLLKSREAYEQCRQTIELQRQMIDELREEKRRLNEQLYVHQLFKKYIIDNFGDSNAQSDDEEYQYSSVDESDEDNDNEDKLQMLLGRAND